MSQFTRTLRFLLVTLAFVGAVLLASGGAFADKITMKDGRVLEGKIQRNEGGVIILVRTVDGKQVTEFISSDDVKSIQVDDEKKAEAPKPEAAKPEAKPEATKPAVAAKPADASKPADGTKAAGKDDPAKKSNVSDRALTGTPTRIAVLNFGSPARNQGKFQDMVGVNISAKAFADVIPMLEKAKVDIVVIRVNSGGGYSLETDAFAELFQHTYKKKFRTVTWIESAISAAAMGPWCIEEMYMMTNGNIGGCTSWSGNLKATSGFGLVEILEKMRVRSEWAGRDPKIMRAMQIMEPLSANIDENGNVTWFQDLTGQILVNRPGEVLTMNSKNAVETKLARGIADTKEELAKALGLTEYEFVAEEATKYIDRFSEDSTKFEATFGEVVRKYQLAVQLAEGMPRERRAPEVGRAQRFLNDMERMVGLNPNFEFHFGNMVGAELNKEFFEEQRQRLRDMLK
ncbi:MAG: hypothetical protein K2X32_07420 [Phycisphaerales bacterium]|nr:hypothetical protein [Phycisphaerales bacterium]